MPWFVSASRTRTAGQSGVNETPNTLGGHVAAELTAESIAGQRLTMGVTAYDAFSRLVKTWSTNRTNRLSPHRRAHARTRHRCRHHRCRAKKLSSIHANDSFQRFLVDVMLRPGPSAVEESVAQCRSNLSMGRLSNKASSYAGAKVERCGMGDRAALMPRCKRPVVGSAIADRRRTPVMRE